MANGILGADQAAETEVISQRVSDRLAPPPREAWLGRLRYVVVPVIAVLAIVAAIYYLDDTGSNTAGLSADATAINVTARGDTSGVPAPRIGSPAADFTLAGLDGKAVKLSDFRGQTVMLNFFATWCPPCRAEMPDVQAAYQQYKDSGVVVLAVNMEEDAPVVSNYVNSASLSFPVVLDRAGNVTSMYRINAIPTSFFIDKNGVLRDMQIGAMSKQLLEQRLKKAM